MLGRLLPVGSKRRDYLRRKLLQPAISQKIDSRFIALNVTQLAQIRKSLESNYFTRLPADYLSSSSGKQDLASHLTGRLDKCRHFVIPWLERALPLNGAKVLEIGCGTGCSTIALAEQGAEVTCVDIDAPALKVARERCQVYGLDAEILPGSAAVLPDLFPSKTFDMIIFYATLEHMTYQERLAAMSDSWEMLSRHGIWCTVDTPNRLAYFDSHTSSLPFYNWLPDELAFDYSKFSPRKEFNGLFRDLNDTAFLEFLRWGRGISFHEFQLSMKGVDLADVDGLSGYLRKQKLVSWLRWRVSEQYKYERVLASLAPDIHPAFFQPSLDLMIRKASA